MLRDRGSRRRLGVFVVLVAVCLSMLVVSSSAAVQELRRGVRFAAAPVQGTLADGTRAVTDVLGAFGEIESLRRENMGLHSSVQQLEEQLSTLDAVMQENARLSRILDVRDRLGFETTLASVTSREATQFERVISIDRGTESGVVKGAPVLSEGGALAGRVAEAGNGWASVMLISDSRSLVIGLDTRTRATGDVTGRQAAPLSMADIPITDKIAVNDRIVTAGIDLGKRFRSSFPRNIPIGRVLDVRQDPGSTVQTALVQPTADLDHLEDVLVVTDPQVVRDAGGPDPTALDPEASADPGGEEAS